MLAKESRWTGYAVQVDQSPFREDSVCKMTLFRDVAVFVPHMLAVDSKLTANFHQLSRMLCFSDEERAVAKWLLYSVRMWSF